MPTILQTCGPRNPVLGAPSRRSPSPLDSGTAALRRSRRVFRCSHVAPSTSRSTARVTLQSQRRSYASVTATRLRARSTSRDGATVGLARVGADAAATAAKSSGRDLVEELAELLDLLLLVVGLEEHAGLVEHLLVGEDRDVARRSGRRARWRRRAGTRSGRLAAVAVELDLGVEGAVVQLGDLDPRRASRDRSSRTVLKRSWVIGRGVSMPCSA